GIRQLARRGDALRLRRCLGAGDLQQDRPADTAAAQLSERWRGGRSALGRRSAAAGAHVAASLRDAKRVSERLVHVQDTGRRKRALSPRLRALAWGECWQQSIRERSATVRSR